MRKLFILVVIFLMLFGLTSAIAKAKKATQEDVIQVSASSQREENVSENVIDGDFGTRWESEFGIDPQWLAIKFNDKRLIEALKIIWENASASIYQIEVSDNGQVWKSVKKIEDGQFGESRFIKLDNAVTTKYLRILGEQRVIQDCGYSILEIELNPFTLDEGNKVKIKKAEASGHQTEEVPEGTDFSVDMAIDGDTNTRWSSEWEDPQWLAVELKEKSKISGVKVIWENASAKVYKIQISNDGKSWKEVASIDNGQSPEDRIITFEPIKTKYVRMYGEERNGGWGYSIWEFEVYK